MKKYIIIGIIFAVLISTITGLSYAVLSLKADNTRLESNLKNYGTEYSDLVLTRNELKDELDKKTAEYITLDSILTKEKLSPKQLTDVVIHKVIITDNDTVYLTSVDSFYLNDTTSLNVVKTSFVDDRNCIRIEGFVLSTDKNPIIAITSQSSEIETYDVTVERKWYQFWKPKEKKLTYTKCGDLEVIRIRKK